MDIRIESAISDEQKQVFLDVIKESFRPLANEGQDCSCYRYTMQDFDDLIMVNYHLFAFVNSVPVGLVSCRLDNQKKYGYIVVIAVLPEYQKYGIGTLLAKRVIDDCAVWGGANIYYQIHLSLIRNPLDGIQLKWDSGLLDISHIVRQIIIRIYSEKT